MKTLRITDCGIASRGKLVTRGLPFDLYTRLRHPPSQSYGATRATAWQETFRLLGRAKSPGDFFSISKKFTGFFLRSFGG